MAAETEVDPQHGHPRSESEPTPQSGQSDDPSRAMPQQDKLDAAHRAFDRGDFQRVRQLCDELIRSEEPEVANAARALRRRVEVDPAQVAIVVGCLVVFFIIAYVYVV